MKKENEKPVYEAASKPSGMDMSELKSNQVIEEARAYRALGLYDEAESTLRRAMTMKDVNSDDAQASLILLLTGQRRFQEAAELGADLIAREVFDHSAIINMALSLNFLGRVAEARDTLLLIEKCGHSLAEEAYQMACFATRLGDNHEALGWLLQEFRRSPEYHARSFQDCDLAPLWPWFRDYEPTLEEAHVLIETPFKDVCAAALDKGAPMELSSDELATLPERKRRLFRFDYSAGHFVLTPLTVAGDPEAAAELERERRTQFAAVEQCIKQGHEHAVAVVLDAQVRYAVEHAQWGNHLGARYHILWALPLRPSLLLDFFNEPGLEMMTPFLTELIHADAEDATFGERMQELSECRATDSERAWKLLEATPASLRTSGLYLLNLGIIYHWEEDYARALPIWEQLRRLWPEDAAGFGNAITALQKLGRDDEARKLLAEAPACYHRFRLYWKQVSELEHTGFHFPDQAISKFRGRPDLGGLLIPAAETQSTPSLPVTEESLKHFVRTRPGRKLTLGMVYVEDIYETILGDGYYSYPQRAFFSIKVAQRCAEWVTKASAEKSPCGYRAIVKPVEIILNAEGQLRVPSPQGAELLTWEEMSLVELINGQGMGWEQTEKYCANDFGFVPDFNDQAGNDL